jgi:hypothetical protein
MEGSCERRKSRAAARRRREQRRFFSASDDDGGGFSTAATQRTSQRAERAIKYSAVREQLGNTEQEDLGIAVVA